MTSRPALTPMRLEGLKISNNLSSKTATTSQQSQDAKVSQRQLQLLPRMSATKKKSSRRAASPLKRPTTIKYCQLSQIQRRRSKKNKKTSSDK